MENTPKKKRRLRQRHAGRRWQRAESESEPESEPGEGPETARRRQELAASLAGLARFHELSQLGVRWLRAVLGVPGAGAILADEMGLGKTVQSCVVIDSLYGAGAQCDDAPPSGALTPRAESPGRPTGPIVLIVAPVTILFNWRSEFARWTSLRDSVVIYHGSQRERSDIYEEIQRKVLRGPTIVVTSHKLMHFRDEARLFRRLEPLDCLLVDEAHALRNANSLLYRNLMTIAVKKRILVTGTPVQNDLAELYNLLQFSMPEAFAAQEIYLAIESIVADPGGVRAEALPLGLAPMVDELSLWAQGSPPGGTEAEDPEGAEGGTAANGSMAPPGPYAGDASPGGVTPIEGAPVGGPVPSAHIALLRKLTAPFILRRLKKNVEHELPQKDSVYVPCVMGKLQKEVYDKFAAAEGYGVDMSPPGADNGDASPGGADDAAPGPDGATDPPAPAGPAGNKFPLLRRICAHPLLVAGTVYGPEHVERAAAALCVLSAEFREAGPTKTRQYLASLSDFELYQLATEEIKKAEGANGVEGAPPGPHGDGVGPGGADGGAIGELRQLAAVERSIFFASCKVRALLGLAREALGRGERVIVFSQYLFFLDLIEHCLRLVGLNGFLRIDGSTPLARKREIIALFNGVRGDALEDGPQGRGDTIGANGVAPTELGTPGAHGARILLMSTRVGSGGLNLVSASTVILMDQSWNPCDDMQAEDRVHRIGQSRGVRIFKLFAAATVEEKVIRKSRGKLQLHAAFYDDVIY